MDNVLNFELLSHPLNWIVVFLTLYFVVLLVYIVHNAATTAPIQFP